jgi:hypothetical protein
VPAHLHLIAFDAEFNLERFEQTLTDFRKFTGRQLSDVCGSDLPACFTAVMREKAAEDRARRF